MNRNILSPYIRVASQNSVITPPVLINDRSLYDYELILVSDGKCRITIDSREYLCQKGDAVWIPPGVIHRFDDADGSSFSQPHFHFDAVYSPSSLKREISYKPRNQMTEEELALIQEDVFADCGIPHVFTPADMERFQRVFTDVIRIFNGKKPGYELLYKARLLELFNLILSQFDAENGAGEQTEANPVLAVKNYIDNNFLRHITLEMLEKQFYINKFTLLRNFRKLYRKNIITYYRQLRLEYAKKLLSSTELSVRSIGEQLNFEDAYSFSRFFKLYSGMSPKTYRVESRKEKERDAAGST